MDFAPCLYHRKHIKKILFHSQHKREERQAGTTAISTWAFDYCNLNGECLNLAFNRIKIVASRLDFYLGLSTLFLAGLNKNYQMDIYQTSWENLTSGRENFILEWIQMKIKSQDFCFVLF